MTIEPYQIYGVLIGIFSVLLGVLLLSVKKIDSFFTDDEKNAKEIKSKRIILGVVPVLAGFMFLSAVLFSWPPIRGYIIPPTSF